MVTPFDADGRVDDEAAVALMNQLLDHGSDGLVIAGTTGEAPTLSDDEQLALIGLAVREVGDRGTIVAGTGSNETRHAVHLTERATELGAHATLSVTPYYNRPNQRGIIAHYEAVAAATDRPVVVYNIPQRTGTNMPPELLARLAQIDGIDAVKQANNDELALIDGLDVYAGNDDILARTLDLGGAESPRGRADAPDGGRPRPPGGARGGSAGRLRGVVGSSGCHRGQDRVQAPRSSELPCPSAVRRR